MWLGPLVAGAGIVGVTIRLVVQTKPLAQWRVARELRARIKRAFDAEGIEIPFPQRSVWIRRGDNEQTPTEGTRAATGR